jgi:hypothetical protein
MFNTIKKRFNISDTEIKELVENNSDITEIFEDYECLISEKVKYKNEDELYIEYIMLVKELEEEISKIISEFDARNL